MEVLSSSSDELRRHPVTDNDAAVVFASESPSSDPNWSKIVTVSPTTVASGQQGDSPSDTKEDDEDDEEDDEDPCFRDWTALLVSLTTAPFFQS